MNGPIAKVLLILPFIAVARLGASAQDNTPRDTNKVRAVVLPEMKKPVKKYVAPSTSERSGVNYGGADTTSTKPVRTTSTDYYTAPTTSERPGYQDYLHPDPPPRQHTPTNVAAGTVSGGVNTTIPAATVPVSGGVVPVGGSSSASTTTTTTTTTTTLPNGQKEISVKKTDTTVYNKRVDTIDATKNANARSMKAIYAEVGGAGLAISVNYDNRIGSERKGLGYRIGAGYFSDGYGNTVFTVPIQVSYLFTKDESNFIELAGGTTFLNSTGNNKGPTFIFDKVTGFIGTATLGYRYQPANHNLNFRINFVPIFYDEGIIWAGGVSIGYNFK